MKMLFEKNNNSKKNLNSEGIIAIFSVLIIMGILGLLTIGFSSIIRQAQKRTLDDHLSSQAFYAAESGINMAISKIQANPNTASKNECGPAPTENYTIDNTNNISVSCLTINTTVGDIQNSKIDVKGVVSEAELSGSADQIVIEWDSSDSLSKPIPDSYPELLSKGGWGDKVGIIKIDLIPAAGPTASDMSRFNLINNSYSFYLYPSQNPASVGPKTIYTDEDGTLIESFCETSSPDNDSRCQAIVNLEGSGAGFNRYYLKQSSLYNNVASKISFRDIGGSNLSITGSQAIIDSTGKANDILRRIRVRVPISEVGINGTMYNTYAIFSGDRICKRYSMTGRNEGDHFNDECEDISNGVVESTSVTPGGGGNGNATIGQWDPVTTYNPNSPEFVFDFTFKNDSVNPNNITVIGCTWDFGDGTAPVDLPANQCDKGDLISHTFVDTRANIKPEDNNWSGCRVYTVTLTMHFAGGYANEIDRQLAYVPRGRADDKPDPSIGRPAGVCYGHFRIYNP